MLRRIACRAVAAALVLTCAVAPLRGDAADPPVRLVMNSLLHPVHFGETGARFAETVRALSGGSLDFEYRDRMVLDQDVFGAMTAGVIGAVWGSAGHHHREDPALTLFSGFPFGPGGDAFTAWMRFGGGQAALDAIYARHGLKSVYCGLLPAETGGWFRAEIASLADLDGLNMRAFGYGAATLRRLGVVPYELPAGEIAAALEAGVIDAAEFSVPSIDATLGLEGAAGYLYFPGWQQPATSLELLMPMATWEALSETQRRIVEVACGELVAWSFVAASVAQIETLERLEAAGVAVREWPPEVLAALRAAWAEVIAEEAAADPLLAAAWAEYQSFAAGWRRWEKLAYPE